MKRIQKWANKKNKLYNREELKLGDRVVVKDMRTGRWDISGVIIDSRHGILSRNGNKAPGGPKDSRSVVIAADNGGQYLRNKRFVKKKTFAD